MNNPSATLADLAQALDPIGGHNRQLLIGDHLPDQDLPLREAGVHEGAVLRFGAPPSAGRLTPLPSAGPLRHHHGNGSRSRTHSAVPEPERELVVIGGLDAGRRAPLWPGTATIGRDPGCDIVLRHKSISGRHAELEVSVGGTVTITDLDSHNGVWLDDQPLTEPTELGEGGTFRLGALDVQVRPVTTFDRPFAIDPGRQATAAGTVPFNRPPRPALPAPHDEISTPDPPQKERGKQPFSLLQMMGPLVFAGGMYLMFQRIMFLMFGLMMPFMALMNFIAGRRRGKKQAKLDRQRYQRELEEFHETLEKVRQEERARRIAGYPDPAEVVRRAHLPSTTLWERRPDHDDFLHLRAGLGDTFWDPPVKKVAGAQKQPPEELTAALEKAKQLETAPVLADLSGGGVVGIVGNRTAALALARSLVCQAAVHHGPADMPVMVLAAPEAGKAWDWAKWLPHTRDPSGTLRMLSADPDLSARMADGPVKAARARDGERGGGPRQPQPMMQSSRRTSPEGPTRLVVVDDESLTQGRRAPTRNLLRGEAGPVAGIVIAEVADRLPAMVTTVVDMTGRGGLANVVRPQEGEQAEDVLSCGVSEDVARNCARALARFEDPELEVVGAGLPGMVRLLPLLELEECTPEAIIDRWQAAGIDPAPAGPIGVTEDDLFTIDFVTDGPHGLVGGTTGAGKSELLRSMVAGMAATVDPDHLTFVLVDFKGGSAFDECAKLPHTVGMVTDLDEHLAERALRCLEAELKYREKLLRRAGASDLPDYLKNHKGTEALPRLVLIIDEFATLKAELPDFIDALVGVAQRGRSLGVHMLLATQRPQGAISENIKANTNMRIALRTQDKGDSNDILGKSDAADISRTSPGRAYVRLGPEEIVPIQSALSTGARHSEMLAPVELAPFVYGPVPRLELGSLAPPPPAPEPAPGSEPVDPGPDENAGPDEMTAGAAEETDLGVLVATINRAFEQTGRPPPRRPWPDDLPVDLDLDPFLDSALDGLEPGQRPDFVPVALADDPEGQTQYPVGWRPDDGNLLLYGIVGSGTTTALSSLALALTRLYRPEDLHLYVLDMGAGELLPLAELPHCGAVVMASERERQQRVVRTLQTEFNRRRELSAAERAKAPLLVTMIDGWSTFTGEFKDVSGMELIDDFVRIAADGPEVGIHVILTADRGTAVSNKITATVRQRWALRLAETNDYAGIVGVRGKAVPKMVPGHALVSESEQLVHIARPADGLTAAVQRRSAATRRPARSRAPAPIRSLPLELARSELRTPAQLAERPWRIPIGMAENDLQPCSLIAYPGEHALIAGPARSGKSTTLLSIAEAIRETEPEALVLAIAGPRSPLPEDPRVDRVVSPDELLPLVADPTAPATLVLVDDAETVEDKQLNDVVGTQHPGVFIAAAGRSDVLRTAYQHWSKSLRRSKLGVLLKPNADLDGELLGVRLRRRVPVPMSTGRGYVVNSGDMTLAQFAMPDGTDSGKASGPRI